MWTKSSPFAREILRCLFPGGGCGGGGGYGDDGSTVVRLHLMTTTLSDREQLFYFLVSPR